MSVFALDSNIVSFYLKGNNNVIENIEKAIAEEHIVYAMIIFLLLIILNTLVILLDCTL